MKVANSWLFSATALLALNVLVTPVLSDDRLVDAIKRVAYWHLNEKLTTAINGTTKTERDFDQCLDLRNPAPVVNRLAQFTCPEFNSQKTQTAWHLRAVCTFANNGHLTGRTDLQLMKNGVGVSYFQEVKANWSKPDGTAAHSERTTRGQLIGECPANAKIFSAGTTTPPAYVIRPEREGR